MYRLVLLAAVALTACGEEVDDRPATLEYVTQAILQPNCGQYVCHSAFRNAAGYAFDSVEAARESLRVLVAPEDAELSPLIDVVTRETDRMPLDSPLFDRDIELLRRWINEGAEGLSP